MRYTLISGLLFLVAACSSWPELDHAQTENRNTRDWPNLLPLSQIIDGDPTQPSQVTAATGDDAQQLSQRAAQLQVRARVLRADASTDASMEALRTRMSVY